VADLLELVLQQLDLFHQLTGLCHVLGLQRITVLCQCAQVCRQRANDSVTLQQCLLEFPQLEHIRTKDIFIFKKLFRQISVCSAHTHNLRQQEF